MLQFVLGVSIVKGQGVASGIRNVGKRIKNSELNITKETEKRIEALIRDYHVVIDLETHTISHDCADWNRVSASQKLCKHIGKLLLSMEREVAIRVLRRLRDEKETWQFKPYTNQ